LELFNEYKFSGECKHENELSYWPLENLFMQLTSWWNWLAWVALTP
jgi:hypothetical protein